MCDDMKFFAFRKLLFCLRTFVAMAIRPRPGVREYVRVNVYELSVDHLTVSEYLRFKEELVNGQ